MIKKKGFTLVEMLVVISVLSVIGVLILIIFQRTLRGANKSQILSSIKQNGQAVLEMMDKTIRNAENVVCPAIPSGSTLASSTGLVIERAGQYTRYRFVAATTSVNGQIKQDGPTKQKVGDRDETDTEFINRICNIADPLSSQALILTDTNLQTGVSLENGSFIRNRQFGFRDVVSIQFDLRPGQGAPQAVAGQIDPVTFQTTVQLR